MLVVYGSLTRPSESPLTGQLFSFTWLLHPSHIFIATNMISFPISFLFSYSPSEMFFGRGGGRLGGRYMKVTYREYTDNTFTVRKLGADSEHLGILGKASLLHQPTGLSEFPLLWFICWYSDIFSVTQVLSVWLQCSAFVQVQS